MITNNVMTKNFLMTNVYNSVSGINAGSSATTKQMIHFMIAFLSDTIVVDIAFPPHSTILPRYSWPYLGKNFSSI